MASLRKLPSGLWNVQLRISGQKAKSASFKSKAEAEAWVQNEKLSIAAKKQTQTLYELGNKYCSVGLRGRPSQKEMIDRIGRICDIFNELSLPLSLDDITREHINTFRLHRLQTVAPATCRKDLMVIGRVYRWAKQEFLLDLSPSYERISPPSERMIFAAQNKKALYCSAA